jgi:hypothetical protein
LISVSLKILPHQKGGKYVPKNPRNRRNSSSKAVSVEKALLSDCNEIKIFYDVDWKNPFKKRNRQDWLKERFKEAGIDEKDYICKYHRETEEERCHWHIFRSSKGVE